MVSAIRGGRALKLCETCLVFQEVPACNQSQTDRFDKISNPHLCYQLVMRFNMDGGDPDYKPFQTPQFTFYALAPLPPKLEATGN